MTTEELLERNDEDEQGDDGAGPFEPEVQPGADRDEAGHGGALSGDGTVLVSGFECLGACDLAPMASIDERYYGPLTESDARELVDALKAGREPSAELALASRSLAGGPDPTDDPRVETLKGPNR